MGTAVRPAKTSPGPWDALADVDAFVDEVLAELDTMAKGGIRSMRSGPKSPLAGAVLRKAVMAIWCVCFCGMQWRAIGLLCDIPFGTLYGLFARWTRAGVVERSFAWLSRYRRLNTIFERSKEHLIAFVAIAFISILARRVKRFVAEEVSA
jgi:hypothetical protein